MRLNIQISGFRTMAKGDVRTAPLEGTEAEATDSAV
jgi:hypothetical protein